MTPFLELERRRRFHAHAVLVGERIALRAPLSPDALATAPLTVEVDGGGAAVVFRHGAVVFVGVSDAGRERFLADMRPRILGPYARPETEDIDVVVDETAREGPGGDHLALAAVTPEKLQLVAEVLARSVLLAEHEARVGTDFDRVEPLARHLALRGRLPSKGRDLLKQVGAMLLIEHNLVGRAELGDKPELLWEHPELESLFSRLQDEFELRERQVALERKLGLLARTVDTLVQLLDARHSLRVEWYIVLLIVFEILLTLYQMQA